jgi:hypothetical protein
VRTWCDRGDLLAAGGAPHPQPWNGKAESRSLSICGTSIPAPWPAAFPAAPRDASLAADRRIVNNRRTKLAPAKDPDAAVEAGLLALHRMAQGYGCEITGADVLAAYSHTVEAAERLGWDDDVRAHVRQLLDAEGPAGFLTKVLGREVGS